MKHKLKHVPQVAFYVLSHLEVSKYFVRFFSFLLLPPALLAWRASCFILDL